MAMSLTDYLSSQFKRLGWQLLIVLTSPVAHLVVLAVGLSFVSWGALELTRSSQVESQSCPVCPNQIAVQLQEILTSQTESASQSTSQSVMTVDVAGAVKKPGLYRLIQSARVADAIALAGGFSETVDSLYVAQQLNLATQLTPDSKLYIPSIGDDWVPTNLAVTSDKATPAPLSSTININSASKTELMELAGVGEVTAQKIISNRPYSSIAELTERDVVTESVFSKIMSEISIQ